MVEREGGERGKKGETPWWGRCWEGGQTFAITVATSWSARHDEEGVINVDIDVVLCSSRSVWTERGVNASSIRLYVWIVLYGKRRRRRSRMGGEVGVYMLVFCQ